MADSGPTGGENRSTGNGAGSELRRVLAGVLRVVPFAASMVLMVVLWGACGGGVFPEVSGSSSPTSTSTKTPGLGNFLYVTENATGFISEYSRNPSTGDLTTITKIAAGNPSGPFGIGTSGGSSPFIYAVNSSTANDNVFGYSLNDVSGALTALSGSPFSAATQPQWIALTPNSPFAYVTNFGSSSISQYTVDSSTGVLTAITPSSVTVASSEPSGAVASDSFLYVSDQGNEQVISFPIDSTTGALQAGTTIPLGFAGAAPGPMIIDASSNYVYVTDTALGLVYAFAITNSGLQAIDSYSSAIAAANASVGLTSVKTSSGLEFLYVANEAASTISIFQVGTGGALSAVSTYTDSHLSSPTGLASATNTTVTNGNSYLYVTNQGLGVGNVALYTINATTGALTFKGTVPTSNVNSQPMFPLIAY
jgi:6-phosphogluconolactonase